MRKRWSWNVSNVFFCSEHLTNSQSETSHVKDILIMEFADKHTFDFQVYSIALATFYIGMAAYTGIWYGDYVNVIIYDNNLKMFTKLWGQFIATLAIFLKQRTELDFSLKPALVSVCEFLTAIMYKIVM